ncbi:MBL fold metallo-hydrolase [Bacillus atrophaeus]|uniref:MBL fold metallo-hydrolase n=1 Tax=Bacillus atrophaeus TaxID=1452 RepID=UPI002DB7A464|nr:MBL fold metallo-hydrolase [Bacillus atrophaeus]MEC0767160.1 MBL fold metallo-hydrolase [Bacillus atrophaeus]MEC0779778.1 MBL fold metallo-hydrolase [Bacillus atrophaeus]MEC0808895.1 MBL fold metallo-hydrolase [Bacillus atrophaeus]
MKLTYEVHQIKTSHHMWTNYCYIIADHVSGSAIVVDPSWELSKITNKLDELEVDLSAILLTHSHYDHVNLVEPLLKLFNPDVYMSKKEIDFYQFNCRNLIALNDNQTISIGNTEGRCLLTPGHTAGGMCYLFPESIFTGDTVFTEGCGICEDHGSSASDMFESIQRIKSEVSPDVRVYPGHSFGKEPGHIIKELFKHNIYFQIDKKEYFVKFRTRKNQKGIFDFK